MNKRGFSLVEVTLALGVAAFCATTLMGLIATGLHSNQSSNERCSASDVVAQLISDLKSASKTGSVAGTPAVLDGLKMPDINGTNYGTQQIYYSEAVDARSNSHFTTGSGATAKYRLSVLIQPPVGGQFGATNVHVRVTWPALANPGSADGTLEVFTALDRN